MTPPKPGGKQTNKPVATVAPAINVAVEPIVFVDDKGPWKPEEYLQNIRTIQSSNPAAVDAYIKTQMALPHENRDYQNLATIGIYGPPEQRLESIKLIVDNLQGAKWTSPVQIAMNEISVANGIELAFVQSTSDEEFTERFWGLWALGVQNEQGYAILHEYLNAIGPNKNHAPGHDFYPANRGKPLQLNPKTVKILQDQYNETQRKLAEAGYPEDGVTLYRGTSRRKGLAMASWTDLKSTAKRFESMHLGSKKNPNENAEIRTEKIPRKYLMGSWKTIRGWKEEIEPIVKGKHEFMVLENAFYGDKQP